jgi:hypothetical protein
MKNNTLEQYEISFDDFKDWLFSDSGDIINFALSIIQDMVDLEDKVIITPQYLLSFCDELPKSLAKGFKKSDKWINAEECKFIK